MRSGDVVGAAGAARALERWGSERGWCGPDPYDALKRHPAAGDRAPLAAEAGRNAEERPHVQRRALDRLRDDAQCDSAATLAHLTTAYARNGFLDEPQARAKLGECVGRLVGLRCATFPEPCWGYHFDVQTRVFFYPRTTPNTIATAFAGLGLLDAHDRAGAGDALELATGAGEFFLRRVPQTPAQSGAYFGYLPGDATPIHNASMLVAACSRAWPTRLGARSFTTPLAERWTTPSAIDVLVRETLAAAGDGISDRVVVSHTRAAA